MKIAVLSDFHLGFGAGTELEGDCFENAKEAMERALDSDLILIGGDIFDSSTPKTQTWAEAIKVLIKPLFKENPGVKLIECSKELKEMSKRTLAHLPVVALHGNHERRARGELNAVQVLESAGLLIHLHATAIVFEKAGVRVAIHGMSAVPERFAKEFLYKWCPKPIEGCVNILFLHQNIDPYVYSPLEPPTLSLSNLPKGFDLIINGHVHMHSSERINGTLFLIPGSLVITQFERGEAEIDKCFLEVEIDEELKVNFVPLQTSRKFFYEEIKIEEGKPLREQIEKKLDEIVFTKALPKPPLIRLRIVGKDVEAVDKELRAIERKYEGKAILRFAKELESPEVTRKLELLQSLREQKLSVEEMGLVILEKNLKELNFEPIFNYESIFRLLSEGEVDKTLNILVGEQRTLVEMLKKSVKE